MGSLLQKENMQKRREAILTEVLSAAIFVDVLQHDNSIPTFFQRFEEEGEDYDGHMIVIPPPSLELKASTTVRGLVQISILPRTLPISSTHAGSTCNFPPPAALHMRFAGGSVRFTSVLCLPGCVIIFL